MGFARNKKQIFDIVNRVLESKGKNVKVSNIYTVCFICRGSPQQNNAEIVMMYGVTKCRWDICDRILENRPFRHNN